MNVAEVTMWVLWSVSITMTLVVYLRVDIHDWGMVGLTSVLMGASILLTRSLLSEYGLAHGGHYSLYAWRIFVFVGALPAIFGFGAGLHRDPPSREQVIRRLVILVAGIALVVLTIHALEG